MTVPPTTGEHLRASAPGAEDKDLGFGSVVGIEAREKRLLNRDGTFNVRREGRPFWQSLSLYHAALTMTWSRFLLLFAAGYLTVNALFALAYTLAGAASLGGTPAAELGGVYWKAFFFSVHTFATIGYGNVAPVGIAANVLVTIESLVGLLGFGIATGLIFARFARPTGRILFSRHAVVAPHRGKSAFMFRIANARSNQIMELEAKVQFSRIETRGGQRLRRYDQLELERTRVVFFPMSWTIVHPITEKSPLHGLSHDELIARDAEFLILLSGVDETFAQTVHARSSYKPEDIAYGARFANIYNPLDDEGVLSIDVRRLGDIEDAPLDGEVHGMHETSTWHHTGHYAGFAPERTRKTDRR